VPSDLLKYHEIRNQSAIAEAGEPELEKTAFKLTEWSGVNEAGNKLRDRTTSSNR
jgi:hypothetical protein